ncbi:hypothetical protein [Paenisporosarcina sp.]|uniref:hypothetical protein n=1 Tax=Paenisporosarcina sp. TaxID=1932001 RepID=UPI003C755B39
MDAKLIVAIIGVIFGISGWTTFFYNHITHIPKIKGRIFSPIVGQIKIEKDYRTFLFYLYLTNNRKTALRVLDYEMELKFTDGTTEKLERFYGNGIYNFTFSTINNNAFNPKLKETLIYNKQHPIDQKEPLHGFVLFGGSLDSFDKDIETYKLTLLDVFGKTHNIIESNMDKKINLNLLSDLAGFDIPQI